MIRDHKELKKTLTNYQLITSYDYVRTFDENYWTDFSISKTTEIVNNQSKYYLIGLSKENNTPFVLYNPNLESIFNEIFQRMIWSNDITGYNKSRNRVIGYYKGNGIIRFGNKSSNPLEVRFEIASLEDIIRKKYYMSNLTTKNRHRIIQSYLLSLGESLGYTVKVAVNDKHAVDKISSNLLIATNINISDLQTKISESIIDYLDVIWFDGKKVVASFEVEFSDNYPDAFSRLSELNSVIREYTAFSVIVSEDKKFYYVSQICNSNYVKYLFQKNNLFYLPLSKLNDCLVLKDMVGFTEQIGIRRNHFLSNTTLHPLINKPQNTFSS